MNVLLPEHLWIASLIRQQQQNSSEGDHFFSRVSMVYFQLRHARRSKHAGLYFRERVHLFDDAALVLSYVV